MTEHHVFLSVGSNLGDPLKNCCDGIDALCEDDRVTLLSRSPFYRTEPVDFRDQNWFINAAILISTSLKPLQLLDKTQDT